MSSLRRIRKELEDLDKNPLMVASAWPSDDIEMHKWTAVIMGRDNSPYQGGIFILNVNLPNAYPFRPPEITVLTRIYHPNIDAKGKVCLEILRETWSPSLTIRNVILSIDSLLTDPDLSDPLVPEIAHVYQTDRAQYETTAREWTQRYAI